MEDAHLIDMDIIPKKDTQLFGVFGGQCEREVSLFVGTYFIKEFLENENYLKGDHKPDTPTKSRRIKRACKQVNDRRDLDNWNLSRGLGDSIQLIRN